MLLQKPQSAGKKENVHTRWRFEIIAAASICPSLVQDLAFVCKHLSNWELFRLRCLSLIAGHEKLWCLQFMASSHFDSPYFCCRMTEETQVKGPSLMVKRGLKGKRTDTRIFRINIKKKSLELKIKNNNNNNNNNTYKFCRHYGTWNLITVLTNSDVLPHPKSDQSILTKFCLKFISVSVSPFPILPINYERN